MLTQKRVMQLFEYVDGKLIRKTSSGNVKAGSSPVTVDKRGYAKVFIDGKSRSVHRVVWLFHYGYLPDNDIDHIDRCKTNNKINNLRVVSRVCNIRNTGNFTNNSSGIKGVCFHNKYSKWRAYVVVNGKKIHLTQHCDFDEAVCHRLAAEQAEDWAGCDSASPAFKYVRSVIQKRF